MHSIELSSLARALVFNPSLNWAFELLFIGSPHSITAVNRGSQEPRTSLRQQKRQPGLIETLDSDRRFSSYYLPTHLVLPPSLSHSLAFPIPSALSISLSLPLYTTSSSFSHSFSSSSSSSPQDPRSLKLSFIYLCRAHNLSTRTALRLLSDKPSSILPSWSIPEGKTVGQRERVGSYSVWKEMLRGRELLGVLEIGGLILRDGDGDGVEGGSYSHYHPHDHSSSTSQPHYSPVIIDSPPHPIPPPLILILPTLLSTRSQAPFLTALIASYHFARLPKREQQLQLICDCLKALVRVGHWVCVRELVEFWAGNGPIWLRNGIDEINRVLESIAGGFGKDPQQQGRDGQKSKGKNRNNMNSSIPSTLLDPLLSRISSIISTNSIIPNTRTYSVLLSIPTLSPSRIKSLLNDMKEKGIEMDDEMSKIVLGRYAMEMRNLKSDDEGLWLEILGKWEWGVGGGTNDSGKNELKKLGIIDDDATTTIETTNRHEKKEDSTSTKTRTTNFATNTAAAANQAKSTITIHNLIYLFSLRHHPRLALRYFDHLITHASHHLSPSDMLHKDTRHQVRSLPGRRVFLHPNYWSIVLSSTTGSDSDTTIDENSIMELFSSALESFNDGKFGVSLDERKAMGSIKNNMVHHQLIGGRGDYESILGLWKRRLMKGEEAEIDIGVINSVIKAMIESESGGIGKAMKLVEVLGKPVRTRWRDKVSHLLDGSKEDSAGSSNRNTDDPSNSGVMAQGNNSNGSEPNLEQLIQYRRHSIQIVEHTITILLAGLARKNDWENAFGLWTNMESKWGVVPVAHHLTILLDLAARWEQRKRSELVSGQEESHHYEEEEAGTECDARNNVSEEYGLAVMKEPLVKRLLERSVGSLSRHQQHWNVSLHEKLPPWKITAQIFWTIVEGNYPHIGKRAHSPADRFNPVTGFDNWLGLRRARRPVDNTDLDPMDLYNPFPSLRRYQQPLYPHIALDCHLCRAMISNLGRHGAKRDIPLVVFWMRALELEPSDEDLKHIIMYCRYPQLSGGEWGRFKRWLEEWLGIVRVRQMESEVEVSVELMIQSKSKVLNNNYNK